jgi:hypothetical protein
MDRLDRDVSTIPVPVKIGSLLHACTIDPQVGVAGGRADILSTPSFVHPVFFHYLPVRSQQPHGEALVTKQERK